MGVIVAIMILAMGVYSNYKYRNWINPASIMCYIWGLVTFLVAIGLFDFYEISPRTWFIIFIGVLSFVIGTSQNISIKTNKRHLKPNSDPKRFVSPKVFWLLFIVVVLFSIREMIISVQLLQRGYPLSVIRLAKLGLQTIPGYSQKNRGLFWGYLGDIITGLSTILIAVGIEYFFSSMRNCKKYLFASIFIVLMDAISEGGRWIIAYMIIECAVCYSIMKHKGRLDRSLRLGRKGRLALLLIVLFLFITMERITIFRSIDVTGEHFFGYLCGCIPLLDIKLGYLQQNNFLTVIFSGQYGIWSFIMPYFRWIFGKHLSIFEEAILVRRYTQSFEFIGNNIKYNAFTTAFYYLFADLRWIGIVIGMLFFGLITKIVYKNVFDNRNEHISSVVPYLIASQMIIKSIQTYPLTLPSYVVVIVLLLIITRLRYE